MPRQRKIKQDETAVNTVVENSNDCNDLPIFSVSEPTTEPPVELFETAADPAIVNNETTEPEPTERKRRNRKAKQAPEPVQTIEYLSIESTQSVLKVLSKDVLLSDKDVTLDESAPITAALNSILTRHLQDSASADVVTLTLCMLAFTVKHGEKRFNQIKGMFVK